MKGNLLIVDDEREISLCLRELLEEEASEIYLASNGLEALSILQEKKVHCIVSDIRMPIMDGLKFLKVARERGHHQPILFFTGHGAENLKKEIELLGGHELFTKPDYLMLEIAIRRYMLPPSVLVTGPD